VKEDCGTVLAQRPGEHRGGLISPREFSAEAAYLVVPGDYPTAGLTSDRLNAA